MPESVWSQSFTIRTYEIDAGGVLAPHTLCDFLQEVAGKHAGSYGLSLEDLLARNLMWVLCRLRVRVERLPAAGETIEVRTWPSGSDRLFALRDFRVVDASGGTVAAAVSAWLILDVAARKPVRPLSVLDLPDASAVARSFEADLDKIPAMEDDPEVEGGAPAGVRFPVRFSDIDVNRHVNNASYVQWIAESAGAGVVETSRLRALDVDFLAETVYGDVVTARARRLAGDGLAFRHSLAREGDGKEIARARTGWGTP
jgi:medium-chain acyl-[acyl-carrier-protein] hydrolase